MHQPILHLLSASLVSINDPCDCEEKLNVTVEEPSSNPLDMKIFSLIMKYSFFYLHSHQTVLITFKIYIFRYYFRLLYLRF